LRGEKALSAGLLFPSPALRGRGWLSAFGREAG
jgi:hypothetical protein